MRLLVYEIGHSPQYRMLHVAMSTLAMLLIRQSVLHAF